MVTRFHLRTNVPTQLFLQQATLSVPKCLHEAAIWNFTAWRPRKGRVDVAKSLTAIPCRRPSRRRMVTVMG